MSSYVTRKPFPAYICCPILAARSVIFWYKPYRNTAFYTYSVIWITDGAIASTITFLRFAALAEKPNFTDGVVYWLKDSYWESKFT